MDIFAYDTYVDYQYTDSNWGDLLTQYGAHTFSYDTVGNLLSDGVYTYTWRHGRQLATMSDGTTTWTYTYDSDGLRTSRTDGTNTYCYTYLDGQLSYMTINGSDIFISYDGFGNPLHITYNGVAYAYVTNLQGDVVALLDSSGTAVVQYTYDAWGKILTCTGSMATTLGVHNPLRYRSYVYDQETGLYYILSRYYNPEVGRWISPEPNVYAGGFDAGSSFAGYNVYAYCANNPIIFSDPTGEWILTALVIGLVVGAAIGGTVGGVVAYNAAESSGLEGSDLFWATVAGVGKGAVIGGIAGAIVGVTGGVVAAYGATSIAGTAMITTTATMSAKAAEVTALQMKKSKMDGDNNWQIANDCIDSVFTNGGKILSTASTKVTATTGKYIATDIISHKVVPLGAAAFLKTHKKGIGSYILVAGSWTYTICSMYATDPVYTANQRGYLLK